MNTYVQLISWTDQGARALKEAPGRLEAAKRALRDLGGELKSFHLTFGGYDVVAIYDLPNDEAAARFTLGLAQAGNVRTQTLKAFSETEYRDLIGSLK